MTDHQAQAAGLSERPGHLRDQAERRALFQRAEIQVLSIAFVVSVATAITFFAIPDRGTSQVEGPVWLFVLAAVLFGLVEYTVFVVHFNRQGMSFTLNEIPIAIALVFLTPAASLIARIPVAIVVLALLRRNQPYKLVFNLAMSLFEMALAMLVFRSVLSASSSSTEMLLVISGTLVILMPLSGIIISLAISRFEGGFLRRVADELRASWWLYPVNTVLATMIVSLMLYEPLLGLLAALPTAGVWYVLYSYGQLSQELRDLDLVHGFAGRVGRSLDVDEIGDAAVVEMTSSFRATGAALVRFESDPPIVHRHGDLDIELPDRPDTPGWKQLFSEGPRLIDADEIAGYGIEVDARRPPLLVGPIVDEGGMLALALVSQAETYGHAFGRSDVARLRNMTQQLGVSLRRGMLHERLEYEARHDALTDLPGRILFERSVERAISDLRTGVWAVLMIDLDRFKEVNDTLGHHAGDNLLIEFSRRISALLAPGDQLARLAGDEFAILAWRTDRDLIVEFAEEVVRAAGRPVTLDGLEIVVTASVGVAEISRLDENAVGPMRRADIAMYNAKWQRTGVELYRYEIDRRTPARLSMLGDLRTAIEDGELDVVYQPKLDLAAGVVVGVEALVRWNHPTRGVVAPAEFVRVAEDTGLIKDLTDLVLSRGIAALRAFEVERLGLAVNLSTHDLFDSRLPDRVREYLDLNGVDPSSLTLEITESSLLIDAPRTRATIDELHDVGLRLAVDDFGTGYSSLSYLRRLPVQELKIDQSFVSGMEHDPQDEVIVRSTVDLGHNLGLRVVAEGVESQLVLERLRSIGCDVAQGFGISVPMSADDVLAWVRDVRRSPERLLPSRAAG